ncbi:MAG: ATP-binding cassette domain-containing protein [Cyclobacteriaceae bacterium]|nr:ATP-binding cassette domain-containing protein [Cyclobacteriaceae bacterium]
MPTSANLTVLEINGLYKSFGDNHVLKDFSVSLTRGENLAVLGKSGSGKSVLIKCIIGLIVPDAGSIKVFGNEVHELGQDELDQMRARIGFLFQSNALYDSMTVEENLLFPLRRHWITEEQANPDDAVQEALNDVGLLHTRYMMPSELSGGMRKRIALARTLILKPEIILYDEPTTGLDPITSREISDLIVKVQRKYNTASMIISHDMSCIHAVANRIVMLIEGRCYANDTYNNLLKSADEKIRDFFLETV